MDFTIGQIAVAILPLFVLGYGAGALRAVALRSTAATRRKIFTVAWIGLLFAGPPLWLFLAANLGWI
jgi:hypothetical protein